MKKIVTLISAAALLVACNDLYGPTESATPEVKSDGIDIEVKLVEDDAVTFTLTPKSEATYYSYLVDQSEEVVALDSAKLFSVSYKSVAQGIINWHDSKSKTLTVSDLEPNTPYVIYAVAGSSTGIPSEVASVTFKTSDKVAPRPAKFSAEGNVVTLVFSEAVKVASGEVTVKYYAINDPEFVNGTPVASVAGTVKGVKGDTATIEFEIPSGAWYSVDVAAGAFEDYAGNASPALASSAKYNASADKVEGRNIFAQNKTKAFSLGKAEGELLLDWEDPLLIDFGSEYEYGAANAKVVSTVTFLGESVSTTYKILPGVDFGYLKSVGKVAFFLPAEPERGSTVTFKIAAGTFVDYYGNANAEWTATFTYAYDYKLEDVLGAYDIKYGSVFDGKTYSGSDVIVASDDEKKGNVMFTSFCGNKLAKPVYATFSPVSGELSIDPFQYCFDFEDSEEEGKIYQAHLVWATIQDSRFAFNKTLPVVLQMPEAGKLVNTGYFGFLGYEDGTPMMWFDGVFSYDASKTAASGSAKANAVSSARKVFSLNAKVVK